VSMAQFLIGDVFARLAEIPDGSVDLVLTSPPFLALRSYLPDGHPDKAKEIGSEPTPAEFLDTLLALTAEWGRVLAPHGSIAVELGDTYAGSGGAGGDYSEGGMRDGQQRFNGAAAKARAHAVKTQTRSPGPVWPLDKSLCGIPTLYAWSLAYGRNLLSGEPSPAGMWRIRNVKPWIRSNPPVGALGDKERPATSYVVVATRARDRYFDLDAVRTAPMPHTLRYDRSGDQYSNEGYDVAQRGDGGRITSNGGNAAGAPPRDWWHHVDAVLDACLDEMAGYVGGDIKPGAPVTTPGKLGHAGGDASNNAGHGRYNPGARSSGARGVHLRRALERAGILRTLEAVDVSPKGYSGAHYAVWPKELVRLLVDEMCPRRVCTTCGEPSRRIVAVDYEATTSRANGSKASTAVTKGVSSGHHAHRETNPVRRVTAEGWSDCGHDTWRPGLVLDPFVGSGTTLAVCSGMGRDSIGIDLDPRNADLARDRVGMFLTVHEPPQPTEDSTS
jgi:hypothetical protein